MTDPIGDKPRSEFQDQAAIGRFAQVMGAKMRKNNHKAHWSTVSSFWLLVRLQQEVDELREAMLNEPDNVVSESADVANFAMMIADNARASL